MLLGHCDLIPRQLHSLLYSKFYASLINSPPVTSYDSSFNPSTYMIEESFKNPLFDLILKPNHNISLNNNNDFKIKVGFLSAFFFHHSVGLLMQGVIKHLRRDIFDVTTIFVTNPPIDKVSQVSSTLIIVLFFYFFLMKFNFRVFEIIQIIS